MQPQSKCDIYYIHTIRVSQYCSLGNIYSNITFNFAIQHYEHAYVLVWEWLAASLNLVVPTREGTQSLWFGAHVLVCLFMSTVSR